MDEIINIWLDSFESSGTRANYQRNILRFVDYLGNSELTLRTLQAWRRSLLNDQPGLRGLIAAVKSLMKFMYNQNFINSNIGRCLRIPKQKPIRTERNIAKKATGRNINIALPPNSAVDKSYNIN